jgi:hypothetical protein
VRQTAGGDVVVNAKVLTVTCVVVAPIARIHGPHIRQGTGAGGDALQHGFKVLHGWRLIAHAHRHDHLVIGIDRQLAVVALQIGGTGLHQMAVGISEVSLGLGRRCAVRLSRQATAWHRIS